MTAGSRLDRLRQAALVRERALLTERQAHLAEKIEQFLAELAKTIDAIREEDASTFAMVRYPRADDIAHTLHQLRDTRTRLANLVAQEHQR